MDEGGVKADGDSGKNSKYETCGEHIRCACSRVKWERKVSHPGLDLDYFLNIQEALLIWGLGRKHYMNCILHYIL